MHLNDINAAARQHRNDLLAEAARDRLARAARGKRASRLVRGVALLAGALASILGVAQTRLAAFAVARRQEA